MWNSLREFHASAQDDRWGGDASEGQASTSFHENISILSGRQGLELLPPMNDGGGIDFRNALQDAGLEFLPGLHPDMSEKRPGHLSKQGFDDIEP